jgi:beta-phosphoglucomutase-like phosphatase (HAD superfamily)
VRVLMAAVVTGDDVAARKPAPDVYLAAASRLGAAPAECVAIEDSAVGVAAAVAAGIRCIAVPNRLTLRHDLSHAHARYATLADVDPDCLAALLE